LLNGQGLSTGTNINTSGKVTVGALSSLNVGGSYTQITGTMIVDGTLTAPSGATLQKGSLVGKGTVVSAITSWVGHCRRCFDQAGKAFDHWQLHAAVERCAKQLHRRHGRRNVRRSGRLERREPWGNPRYQVSEWFRSRRKGIASQSLPAPGEWKVRDRNRNQHQF
jgi:hypothetical protein